MRSYDIITAGGGKHAIVRALHLFSPIERILKRLKMLNDLPARDADVGVEFPASHPTNPLGHLWLRAGLGLASVPHVLCVGASSEILDPIICAVPVDVIDRLGPNSVVHEKDDPMRQEPSGPVTFLPNHYLGVCVAAAGVPSDGAQPIKASVPIHEGITNDFFLFWSHWFRFHNLKTFGIL
jgi:hypothetical protein